MKSMCCVSNCILTYHVVWIVIFGVCWTQDTGSVRLFRGNNSTSGIVQIYTSEGIWTTVCGLTFTDQAAEVTCKQLGFEQGLALPLGSYGQFNDMVLYNGQLKSCVSGQENRLVDCVFENISNCLPVGLAYASVNCYNGQLLAPDDLLRLDSTKPTTDAGYFTRVQYYRTGIWGNICGQFWDDAEAIVVCRQLGYQGGVATYSKSDWFIPILMSEVNCIGNETGLTNCPQKDTVCYGSRVAAVVCHQTINGAPQLSLKGGKAHYGKVVFTIDGQSGLLCNAAVPWTYKEASVVCRQLGYTEGYVLDGQYDAGTVQGMVLDYITCASGEEETIIQCGNGGWRNISAQCSGPSFGVSVYCYSNVRLVGSQISESHQLRIGSVQVRVNDTWYPVCSDVFNQNASYVTCKQFGFPVAEILMPGNFEVLSASTSVSALTCNGGESNLSNCSFSLGKCLPHNQHAAVLCKHLNTSDGLRFNLSENYFGLVQANRFGISGHVCRAGWEDNDASVLCRQTGHHSGIALGTRTPSTRYQPVWVSRFSCNGTETNLSQCGYQTNLSADWSCAEDLSPAGALCFLSKPPDVLVRMADGISVDHGRVEVYNDVTGWGTVCDSGWGNTDAAVICRQLGFADGQVSRSAYKTTATGVPVLLSNLACNGDEKSLFRCGNNGWKVVPSYCLDHSRDAGVYCYRYVQLEPSSSAGAVQYHTGEKYGLVCADGFDDQAATAVCTNRGYFYGKSLCCSAFGPKSQNYSMSNVKCAGGEKSLLECTFTTTNVTCASRQYASVACTNFNIGYTSMTANPVVRVNYFTQSGLVCSDGFTDFDATVVCNMSGFTYGKRFKYSGIGLETNIRWLRGLNCKGFETSIQQCGPHDWGQIGVCSWGSVAAVLCSNNKGDMVFDIRIANGSSTSGRVEIKVKGSWGTICGNDMTRDEANVICRQLGYDGGINLAPGSFGSGSGDVILRAIDCAGNESSVADCIWSGYGTTSLSCDHSKDAAVKCFYKTRLDGSTTINYGRLEIYDSATDKWLAVCDRNLNVNNANIICRQMGYVDDVALRLPLSSFYGPVSIRRFGLWGHICSKDFDDNNAIVVCSQLGYPGGVAVKTFATPGYPIIQGSVDCLGDEASLASCTKRALFAEDPGCFNMTTVAGVICYTETGLSFSSTDLDHTTGRMSSGVGLHVNGQTLYISQVKFTNVDAAVYCSDLGYAGGETYHGGSGSFGVSDLTCTGMEETILQCQGTWDPEKTKDKSGDLAGVTCFTAVRLAYGDPTYYGVVYTSKGVKSGPVCADGFDTIDAGIACKSIGYDSGLVLCCAALGTVDQSPVSTNVQCTGKEKQFTSCKYDEPVTESCSRNYAAVVCYSGTKPMDYTISFPATDSSTYAGNVVLTYMGINGSICMDGWDDKDAHVACRELGFQSGVAYNAAKSATGPYWASNVNCQGTESKLSQCQMTPFGEVKQCKTSVSHAGVICYGNQGIYSRLYGTGEARYGRVELSVAGEWRSLCNVNWDHEDAHVLCKMLDFRTGESFQGLYNETISGPVWDINFRCDGTEAALTKCLSSGWKSSTTAACAKHENDAGAFCYTSVKLSTGVGREKDQGAVLLYKDDRWYTVCNDGFTANSARAVCRELGFVDGQVQCCTDYGKLEEYPRLLTHKVKCNGDETDVTDCLVEDFCSIDGQYASVVCYGFGLGASEPATKAPEKTFDARPVIIAVVLSAGILIIFMVVFFIVRKRRKQKKLDATKEEFSRTSMRQRLDGSVAFENVLHDDISVPSGTPVVTPGVTPGGTPDATPGTSRVSFKKENGEQSAAISASYDNMGYMKHMDRNGAYAYDKGEEKHIYDNPANLKFPTTVGKTSEYDNPPSNKTIISVSNKSNPYDYPRNNRSVHLYDSLKHEGFDGDAANMGGAGISSTDTGQGTQNNYLTTLSDQTEVASPTEDKLELHFQQTTENEKNG